MFREIRTSEKFYLNEEKKEEGYKKIKPEKELYIDEINNIVLEMFNQASKGI